MLSGSSGPLPSTGGTPPADPSRGRLLALLLGILGTAGAVFFVWRAAQPPRVYSDPRNDRKRTVEVPYETSEEIVWERRR